MMRAADSRLGLVCGLSLTMASACRVGGTRAVLPESADRDADYMSQTSPSEAGGSPLPGPRDAGAGQGDTSAPESCSNLTDCEPPAGCEAGEYAGHVYFFCAETLPWQQARERCISSRVDLAIIDDEAENGFVSMRLAATSWIGLADLDVEGDYRWVDPRTGTRAGSAASFTKWAATKPDNCGSGLFGEQDCVRVSKNGKWDDSACEGGCTEGTFAFVCESY